MLEVCARLICALIMTIFGIFVIEKITNREIKVLSPKTIIEIIVLCLATIFISKKEYAGIGTIAIFALQIIVYKEMFNLKVEESLIACGIVMMLTIFGDLMSGFLLMKCFTLKQIRSTGYLYILSNILVAIFGMITLKVKLILRQLQNFYNSISRNKSVSNILFVVLLIIGLSSLGQNVSMVNAGESNYYVNITIMIIFFLLSYFFIKGKNNYEKLNSEYENLFTYV